MEIWKDIKGYEGVYQVSSLGRVKSLDRISYNPRYGECKLKGQMLKACPNSNGYLGCSLVINGITKHFRIHRLVAMAFLPVVSNKLEINHIDGNKANNKLSNIEWCNRSENITHAFRLGLKKAPKGVINGECKLTEKQVLEIRQQYLGVRKGVSMDYLALKYNISRSQVSRILKRQSWKHI